MALVAKEYIYIENWIWGKAAGPSSAVEADSLFLRAATLWRSFVLQGESKKKSQLVKEGGGIDCRGRVGGKDW